MFSLFSWGLIFWEFVPDTDLKLGSCDTYKLSHTKQNNTASVPFRDFDEKHYEQEKFIKEFMHETQCVCVCCCLAALLIDTFL